MEIGGWSLDQLMELAGLSVSQAGKCKLKEIRQVADLTDSNLFSPSRGDGLVAARHLAQYGYEPSVYYPKEGKNELYQIEAASVPVLSVDAPSSWDIEGGPPKEGPGSKFMPEYLISLTAPKPCVKYYQGRHFLGGRFLTKSITEKYGLDLPNYPGIDQIVEVGVDAEGRL
ncbi:unnamed protein product [Aspergillus oryzae]|uniref:NAD(P)H-hydrate epimerase n=2 Tax=Aspergillus oryzae TaxID=5062 RepID=A0AAN4YP67_ASPOZ|nr:unnamed protein product [Aspergillus oryzae]GMF90302.1 unnamed protein product [Aspergillus oryzae]GMG05172.1 unnamed protein product [Aspergillus oryzae]GMG31007.1 unnamed protein product [Aspergillus oryzae]GMG47987.1 unnamed protein product [Aspergillus oryzae var. brunneus]